MMLINSGKEGGSNTVVKTIIVEVPFNLYIPHTFIPTEDDNNEYFLPITTRHKLYQLMVFNHGVKRYLKQTTLTNVRMTATRIKPATRGAYLETHLIGQ